MKIGRRIGGPLTTGVVVYGGGRNGGRYKGNISRDGDGGGR